MYVCMYVRVFRIFLREYHIEAKRGARVYNKYIPYIYAIDTYHILIYIYINIHTVMSEL